MIGDQKLLPQAVGQPDKQAQARQEIDGSNRCQILRPIRYIM